MKTETIEFKALKSLFIRKLMFWAMHCVISALPGFFTAIVVMDQAGEWDAAAVFPMLAAVVSFVLTLAVFFTWLEAKNPMGPLLRKGLTSGLRIRIVMVVAGLLILAASSSGSYKGLFLIPDVWFGLLAALLNHWICMAFGNESGIESFGTGDGGIGFGTVYALSMTVGAIIALVVFILSFISTLIFQMRMRSQLIARQDTCPAQMGDLR